MLFLLNYLFCNGLNPSKAPSYVTPVNSNPTYTELHECYKNFIINFSEYFKYIDTNNEPIYLFSKDTHKETLSNSINYFKKYIFFHLKLFFKEDIAMKNTKLPRLNELFTKLKLFFQLSDHNLFYAYYFSDEWNSYIHHGTLKAFLEILEVCDIYKLSNQEFFKNIPELQQSFIDENSEIETESINDIPKLQQSFIDENSEIETESINDISEVNNIQNPNNHNFSFNDLEKYYKNFILHFSQYFRHTHIDPSDLFLTNEYYKTKESLVYYFEQCIYLHLNFFEKNETIKNEKLSKLRELFIELHSELSATENNILWMLLFPERENETTPWLFGRIDNRIYLSCIHLKLVREILEVCDIYKLSNIETFNTMPELVRTQNIEKFISKYRKNTNNLSIDLMLSSNEFPDPNSIKKNVPRFLKKIKQIFQINDIDINASNNQDMNEIFLKLANVYLPYTTKKLPLDIVNVGTAYNLLNDLLQFKDISQQSFVKRFTLLQINPFNILVNYFVWIIEQKKQFAGEFYSHDDLVLTFENFLLKDLMSIDDVLKKALFEEQELSKINDTDTEFLFEEQNDFIF